MRFVLLLALLTLIGCNPITATDTRVGQSTDLLRAYPSMSLLPTAQVIPAVRSLQVERSCMVNTGQPYTFTNTTNPQQAWGKVYYSDGTAMPVVINNNGMSPMVAGGQVYFVRIDGVTGSLPSTSTIVKYNPTNGTTSTVVTTKSNPPWSNFDVSQDGLTIIYNDAHPNYSGCKLYITQNGQQEYYSNGRYYSIAISGDGSTAYWIKDVTNPTMGDHDLFRYSLATENISTVHNTASGAECADVSCDYTGDNVIYRVQVGEWSGGNPGHWSVLDSELWFYHIQGINFNNRPTFIFTAHIDTSPYQWCEIPNISHDGRYIVAPGNQDVELYAGYCILGVEVNLLGSLECNEITNYNPNLQDLWADVDPSGTIIYGNCIAAWSKTIPAVASFSSGELGNVVDMSGISRDFSY